MSETKEDSGQISSNRPPFETLKRATCRGSILLGSACGSCERCAWERARLSGQLAKAPSKEEKLRALVEKWKMGAADHGIDAKNIKSHNDKWLSLGAGVTMNECARELESLLDAK